MKGDLNQKLGCNNCSLFMGKRKFSSLPQIFISDGQFIKSISEKQMIYKNDQWKSIKKQSERQKIESSSLKGQKMEYQLANKTKTSVENEKGY
jgi:hypothetical protein